MYIWHSGRIQLGIYAINGLVTPNVKTEGKTELEPTLELHESSGKC